MYQKPHALKWFSHQFFVAVEDLYRQSMARLGHLRQQWPQSTPIRRVGFVLTWVGVTGFLPLEEVGLRLLYWSCSRLKSYLTWTLLLFVCDVQPTNFSLDSVLLLVKTAGVVVVQCSSWQDVKVSQIYSRDPINQTLCKYNLWSNIISGSSQVWFNSLQSNILLNWWVTPNF